MFAVPFLAQAPSNASTSQVTNLVVTLAGGLIAAGLGLLSQYLAHKWHTTRSRTEQLMALYSQFAGVVAADVGRGKGQVALAVFSPPDHMEIAQREEWGKNWGALEKERRAAQAELDRLDFQLQLTEADPTILQALKELRHIQPFLWIRTDQTNSEFQQKVETYEKKAEDLWSKVRCRYARHAPTD